MNCAITAAVLGQVLSTFSLCIIIMRVQIMNYNLFFKSNVLWFTIVGYATTIRTALFDLDFQFGFIPQKKRCRLQLNGRFMANQWPGNV